MRTLSTIVVAALLALVQVTASVTAEPEPTAIPTTVTVAAGSATSATATPPGAQLLAAPSHLPPFPLEGAVPADMIGSGVWWRPVLDETEIERVMANLNRWGIRNCFVEAFRGGRTIYPSAIFPPEKSDGRDWLALTCAIGRRHNVRVHAWIHTLFWRHADDDRRTSHILDLHPQWVEMPRPGPAPQSGETKYVFVSPAIPEVRNLLVILVDELAQRDIAGVNLDYIRFQICDRDFGYNPATLDGFERESGLRPVDLPRETRVGSPWMRWVEYREKLVTDLVATLADRTRALAKQKGARLLVSSAYFPGYAAERGRNFKFQNWTEWVKRGYLDVSTPMCYAPDAEGLRRELAEVRVEHAAVPAACIPGIALGTFSASHPTFREQRPLLEEAGFRQCMVFKYETLRDEFEKRK
jgi:uncharacterized lipoprotein YddW (UPF0748 family)